ncbi:hypothetical protein [Thermocrinis jamiesonii]|jgi:hypothetical protein|uniref:hypothetical protein n=1 Tax=Thermocrinis jamiesonii TaxID=1302351 RepID=UPI000495E444|nr:hypothetical protein [Thermocrinis jamiesonii]
MEKEREELKVESLEQEVKEMREEVRKIFELLLPPKEVRREIMKNLYTIELSVLKIFKTLLDYKTQELEKKIEGKEEVKKEKVKRIQVE